MNVSILDFGAIPGAQGLCTEAMQAAIDACAAAGGGRVDIPCGTFITGTIWLRSHVELHLCHGAIWKASENLDDYNNENAYEQNFSSRASEKWLGKHLLIAHECEDVALTGTGTIDGSGDAFYSEPLPYSVYVWREGCREAKDAEICRPGQLLCFIECRHVRVQDVTLTNQPCWGCFLHGCEYVQVRGMRSINDHAAFNSDGIDIDCCRYVTISDCILDTGDDSIAIRGAEARLKNKPHPCEYITITNCVIGSSSNAIRLGVGKGLIRHVRISNITITRAAPAITLMSSYHGKGCVSIEDVSIMNVSATSCTRGIEILEGAGASIRNIVMENIFIETDGYFVLQSDAPHNVSDVTLRNLRVILTDGPKPVTPRDFERKGTVWFRATNIDNLTLDGVDVRDGNCYLDAWEDGIFSFVDCEGLILRDVRVNGELRQSEGSF